VNGDNNVVNTGGGDTNIVCPYADRYAAETPQIQAEEAVQAVEPPAASLTQEEIERQREAVKRAYKRNIKQQVGIKRRALSFALLFITGLICATFFIHYIPYTQKHDMNNDERLILDSTGADIIVSALTVLHFDDIYDKAADIAAKIGIDFNAAYYDDVIMEIEGYGYWQTWLAHSLPLTLALALIFVVVNILLFLLKFITGNLKRKFYIVSLLQFIFLAVAAAEVLIMTKLQPDVFSYEMGYGLILALVLSLAVVGMERFFGKRYAMSEKDRVRSLYGY
jgi:hypothetical protein